MRSIEAEYFLRLARVGAVVLAVTVVLGFVYNAQRRAAPPPAIESDEGPPVLLLENARIVEEDEPVEVVVDVDPFQPARPAPPLGVKPLVAPVVRPDIQQPRFELPAATPDAQIFGAPDPYISSSKSIAPVVTSPAPPKRSGQK